LYALIAQAFFEQGGAQSGGADVSQQISGGIVQWHVKDGFQVSEGFNRPTGDGPR
jgi:phosphate/sulfate permease